MILKTYIPTLPCNRKGCFRLWAGLFLTLLSSSGYTSQAANIATTRQIDLALTQAARLETETMAAAQGWKPSEIKTVSVIPPEAAALPPCGQPLVVRQSGGGKRMAVRLRYEIGCPEAGGWTLAAAVKTSVTVPLLVSTGALERGQTIGPEDVTLKEQSVPAGQERIYTVAQEVIGQTVKRRISAGQTLTASHIERPVIIARGDRVTLVINNRGIEARTIGEALKPGRKGETIRVRNISSQRTLDGLVEAPGVVRVLSIP